MPNPTLPKKLAFVDIETTGGRLKYDRIIEIGIVRVEDGVVTQTFRSLINPNQLIPAEITQLTNITSAQVEAAPTFREIADEILALLDDCVFVAHNVRFDYSFLKEEFRRLETPFAPKQCCTVKISRNLYPEHRHHNLDSILERFPIECANRHRAFDDAQVIWEFYRQSLEMVGEERMLAAVNLAMKRPSLPIRIPVSELDNLPESPGVYIFLGENGMPLYVGKSINIRDRVLSHFSSDHLSTTEMKISQQIERIQTITTAGELGALLKEAGLVKKLQPLFNRKLRLSQKLIVAKKRADEGGYINVILETLDSIQADQLKEIVGVFRSKKRAQDYLLFKAREQSLCERLLGIEKTKSGCFSYRLGRCKGACVGKEEPARYNARLTLAISQDGIRPWPFTGPVVIRETDPETGKAELFLVDQWCLLGWIEEGHELQQYKLNELTFDLDAYKILNTYLRSKQNAKNIATVTPTKFQQIIQNLSSI